MSELTTTDGLDPSPSQPLPLPVTPASAASAADARPRPGIDWRALAARLPGLGFEFCLVGLLVVGIIFRFSWVNWNQNTDLHPDEYGLTSTLTRLSIPKTIGDYFNTRLSSISPYQKYDLNGKATEPGPDNRMRWGQWPIILIRLAAELTKNTGYIEMRLLGRQLSALSDVLALFVLYLIGRRLYSHRVGLLGAALSALAVMQIQQSHFMTSDNFAVLFTVLSMYCAVRVAQQGRWGWYALFGVFFGMAVASRINLAPLAGEILVAALIANSAKIFRERSDLQFTKNVGLAIGLLLLAGATAIFTFRVTHPMAFRAAKGDTTIFTVMPNPEWTLSMQVAQAESSGEGGGPPGEQWTNRPAIIFPLTNIVLWGMGLPLGLAAWAGLGWALWRVLQKKDWLAHLLPLTWTGGYFLFMGTRWVKSMRYFLPIYPFLALFAAWLMIELWKIAKEKKEQKEIKERGEIKEIQEMKEQGELKELPSSLSSLASLSSSVFPISPRPRFSFLSLSSLISFSSILIGALVLLGALTWAYGFTSIYRTDNTRIQASRWIYQNVPAPISLQLDTGAGPYTEPIPVSPVQPIAESFSAPINFSPRVSGSATQVSLGYARSTFGILTPITLHVVLAADPKGLRPLAAADIVVEPTSQEPRGGTGVARFAPPAALEKDKTYYLLLTAPRGAPVQLTGATIANEDWDEGLPLRLDGRDGFGGLFQGRTMNVRWGENEDKRNMFLLGLSQTDYIILPSQRGIWSTSRLPATYPMTMEYYRALFDGRLGYDLVATFTSPITLGPLQISDVGGSMAWNATPELPLFNNNPLAAEEAFSVYDHAPVWIFKKRADFDFVKAMAVLAAIDLKNVTAQGPREATAAPTLLMLPEDRLAEQRAGGTWAELFNRESLLNQSQGLGVAVWWLTCLVLGWLAFPIAFVALPGLPDRGYALARNLSLVLIAWAAWLLGSFRLLPFTQATLWLMAGVMALASALIGWRRRVEIVAWVKGHVRYLLVVESFALFLFIFFLLIRLGNGDLWHPAYGGEKPMDFSYFNAVLKSTSFPPYDPWFAGGHLNYYYYGFVIVSVPTKLLGIAPAFAYNLILPMLFSLAGIGAFCVAYNLVAGGRRLASLRLPTRESLQRIVANPYLAGVMAACLFVVLGNLGEPKVISKALMGAAKDIKPTAFAYLNEWAQLGVGAWRVYVQQAQIRIGTGEWYWNATRVIPDSQTIPITEFPFFTFLYADLHAHLIVLIITVLALAWALSLVLAAKEGERRWIERIAPWIVGGLAFGAIQPSNLSDYQTYWALGCLAIGYAELRKREKLDLDLLKAVGWRCALFIGLVIALYWPYAQWRGEGYGSVKLWDGAKTTLDAYLTIHGLFLFIVFTFLLTETRRWMQRTLLAEVKDLLGPALFALVALALVVLGMAAMGYSVAVIAVPLIAWASLLIVRQDAEPERRIALGLIGLGLTLTVVVEVVVAKGDIGRMNTVFKFYLQVWTLLSVAGGAAAAWIWAQLPEWKLRNRVLWQIALIGVVTTAALYTVLATSAKVRDRMAAAAPRTLDGMLYMAYSQYSDKEQKFSLKGDYEAIKWMQENVKGSPVIVEVNAPEYRWGSRYTINTGLPGVLGWNWHQRQQRVVLSDRLVWNRANDINAFYKTVNSQEALNFLKKYAVAYIVVGEYERIYFPSSSLAKFEQMTAEGLLNVVYRKDKTVIYQVAGGGP